MKSPTIKLNFYYCQKSEINLNSEDGNDFGWNKMRAKVEIISEHREVVIRTQPLSVLKIFLLYQNMYIVYWFYAKNLLKYGCNECASIKTRLQKHNRLNIASYLKMDLMNAMRFNKNKAMEIWPAKHSASGAKFFRFLVQMKPSKSVFEIYWPLA